MKDDRGVKSGVGNVEKSSFFPSFSSSSSGRQKGLQTERESNSGGGLGWRRRE